jgi:hypothetical protein
VPRFRPIRLLSRGFGGSASAVMVRAFLSFDDTIIEIRKKLGGSSNKNEFIFDDEVNVYKISAMLKSINETPLSNTVYSKITKLIVEKKIGIDVALVETTSRNSAPYKIVIGEYKIKRGYDE